MGVSRQNQIPSPQQNLNPSAPGWMSQYKWDPNWINSPQSGGSYTPSSGGSNLSGTVGALSKGATLAKGLSNYMGGGLGSIGTEGANAAYGSAVEAAQPMIDSTSADIAASNDAWLSSLGGATPAAGAAAPTALAASDLAPVGVDAATAAPTITGLDTGSSGATAGLGAGAGAGTALGLAALPAVLAMTVPDSLSGSYYRNMNQTLASGPGTTPQQIGQYWGALNQASNSGDPRQLAMLQQYGITPAKAALQGQTVYMPGGINGGKRSNF